jgi:hypothetical protein
MQFTPSIKSTDSKWRNTIVQKVVNSILDDHFGSDLTDAQNEQLVELCEKSL